MLIQIQNTVAEEHRTEIQETIAEEPDGDAGEPLRSREDLVVRMTSLFSLGVNRLSDDEEQLKARSHVSEWIKHKIHEEDSEDCAQWKRS